MLHEVGHGLAGEGSEGCELGGRAGRDMREQPPQGAWGSWEVLEPRGSSLGQGTLEGGGKGWGLEGSASCLLTCSLDACACEGFGHGECQATSEIPRAGWML